jgi:hypothetical protein
VAALSLAVTIIIFCSTLSTQAGTQGIYALPADTGVYAGGAPNLGTPNSVSNVIERANAGNTKTLAQFKTDMLAVFNANSGGVITFDHALGKPTTNTTRGRFTPAPPI